MERRFVNKLLNYQKSLGKEDPAPKIAKVPGNRRRMEEDRSRKPKGTRFQELKATQVTNGEWRGDSPLSGTIRKGRANVKNEQYKRWGDPRASHFLRFS